MRLYELLGRLLSPAILFFLRVLSYFHKTVRVRVLIRNEQDEILLVKNWIGKNEWEMPGGGVGRGEMPLHAAIREVHEETGIHLEPTDLRQIATYLGRYETNVFVATIGLRRSKMMKRRKLEITAMEWQKRESLPAPLAWNVPQTLLKLPK
jgi:8-oxo-dGTP pyrophosphatase MutT (NUDIX family)